MRKPKQRPLQVQKTTKSTRPKNKKSKALKIPKNLPKQEIIEIDTMVLSQYVNRGYNINLSLNDIIVLKGLDTKQQIKDKLTEIATKQVYNKVQRSNAKIRVFEKKKEELEKKRIIREKAFIKKAEEFRLELIKKQTKPEIRMRAMLKALKIPYDFQKIFYVGKTFRIVDFYIPHIRIVLEVDGGYHDTDEQRQLDFKREWELKHTKEVKNVIRMSNAQVMSEYCQKGLEDKLRVYLRELKHKK